MSLHLVIFFWMKSLICLCAKCTVQQTILQLLCLKWLSTHCCCYYSNFNLSDAGKMTTAKSNIDLFGFLVLFWYLIQFLILVVHKLYNVRLTTTLFPIRCLPVPSRQSLTEYIILHLRISILNFFRCKSFSLYSSCDLVKGWSRKQMDLWS